MPVLGHASLKTSEDAYNHAESFEAFGQWHELLIASHVPDRENAFRTRIGAMWPHEDGKGYSLDLELMPTQGGRIILRAFEPKSTEQHDGS
jgi:hypothetical protein